jgi:hypothetical protein
MSLQLRGGPIHSPLDCTVPVGLPPTKVLESAILSMVMKFKIENVIPSVIKIIIINFEAFFMVGYLLYYYLSPLDCFPQNSQLYTISSRFPPNRKAIIDSCVFKTIINLPTTIQIPPSNNDYVRHGLRTSKNVFYP